jgi:hypothetical protein
MRIKFHKNWGGGITDTQTAWRVHKPTLGKKDENKVLRETFGIETYGWRG